MTASRWIGSDNGILVITSSFNVEDKARIRMMKFMEDNLTEYNGMLGA